jgi:hypothetical protein
MDEEHELILALSNDVLRLRAEVAELRDAQTPRPMETAPRDGTEILVWQQGEWALVSFDTGDWYTQDGVRFDVAPYALWLPLPPAPTTEGA